MKIFLGIDPGTRYSGYALLRKNDRQVALLAHGCLSLGANRPLQVRIGDFYQSCTSLIAQWQVTDIVLETPFLGKNAQNFLKLGYLRGIIYLLAQQHALTLSEFSPREVKQSVTGYGGASKQQVAYMVAHLFSRMATHPLREDETDALAVALCGVWKSSSQSLLGSNTNKIAQCRTF